MTGSPAPTLEIKRNQWLDALRGDDRHAIVQQLLQMSWDAASFRVVNEARRIAPPAPEGGVQLNGLIHSLIDRGFFTTQIVGVGRLMDTYELEGKKGVYSLSGLLKDMQKNRDLLTRKNIFETENLVYDYESIRQTFLSHVAKKDHGEQVPGVPKGYRWQKSERRHEVIDVLTGTTSQNRQPDDTILDVVFANLFNKASKACREIIDHATKFIAHAATPESRAIANADEIKVTLGHLWTAHRHLCEVTGFLAIVVLGDSCPSFLPAVAYDQFLYMDKPLLDSFRTEQLELLWSEFERDCQKWSQWNLDAYTKEFS